MEGIPYLLEVLHYQIDYWNFIGSNFNDGCIWYSINNPQESIDSDIKMCIICQIDTKKEPNSSEKGRQRILEAATIRKRHKPLKTIGYEPVCYHTDTHRYQTHRPTHQKSVDKHQRVSSVPPDQAERCPETTKRSRSLSTARNPVEKKVDIYTTPCVICGEVKYQGSTNIEYVNLEGLSIS